MHRPLLTCLLLLAALPCAAQVTGDTLFQKKTAGGFAAEYVTIPNNQWLWRNGSGVLGTLDAAGMRGALGLSIGADIQAYDSDLAAIAALSTTSYGRSLLTLADAAALRTAGGLVIGTNVQAYDAELAALAALDGTAGVVRQTGAGAFSKLAVSDTGLSGAVAQYGTLGSFAAQGAMTLYGIASLEQPGLVFYRYNVPATSGSQTWVQPTNAGDVVQLQLPATSGMLALLSQAQNAATLITGTLDSARLPNSGAVAGTYASVTVDAKGRVVTGVDTRAAFPPGHLDGLTLSISSGDAANDIDIAAGSARDSTDVANLVLASAITKRLDAAWAVGNGGGGLDAGTKAVSTWYALHLIRRPDTGVVDVLFSASGTAPTMPANYTQRRRLGWVRTDGSGNLTAFFQAGDDFFWRDYVLDYNASMPTTATLITLSVPPQEVIAQLRISLGSSATHVPLITSPSESDRTPSTTYNDAVGGDAYGGGRNWKRVLTNAAGQVRARSTSSTGTAIHTSGWTDLR